MSNGTLPLVDVTTPGVRWRVLPDCRDLLFGPEGLRLQEWLRGGMAQVVKHGPHRTVYRVVLPELSFYLKHYRLADLRAWARQLVRPAKARMEFDRALAIAARQVPTFSPLAVGEGHGQGPCDSFLITRSLENAEPVSAFVESSLPQYSPARHALLRRRLAEELGAFVAKLHNTGIVHHDLHAANILVHVHGDDRLSLHLIDLHAVNLGRPLGWRVSRDNLVVMNRWFVLRASRSDRLRFWLAYCRTRLGPAQGETGASGPEQCVLPRSCYAWRDLARDLEEQTWRSNLRFWAHRDRRCRESNRYYHRVHTRGVAGYAVRELDPDVLANLMADPDVPFKLPGVKLLKDSRSSTVAEFDLRIWGQSRRVIYKRFRVTSWRDPWAALAQITPAVRSWIYGHGLRERCLATARPLAALHRRRGRLLYEGYLLTEKILDAVDLHGYLSQLQKLDAEAGLTLLRRRIDQVATIIKGLHRRQLSHRDLKAGNILVARDRVWLIDLVGIKLYRQLSFGRRVQNLARLHASFYKNSQVTRTDKLRFLRAYSQWGLFGKGGWKNWWRKIDAATQAKVQRNLRSGRPLA